MAKLFAATPLPVLKDWLAVRLAKDRALVLPPLSPTRSSLSPAAVLGGATQSPARWLQAIELTAAALTDAVSKPYIERHFPPATKAAMDELVGNRPRRDGPAPRQSRLDGAGDQGARREPSLPPSRR